LIILQKRGLLLVFRGLKKYFLKTSKLKVFFPKGRFIKKQIISEMSIKVVANELDFLFISKS